MNLFKIWWLKWFYRKESKDELMVLLELSIKAGRRVTHDLGHCVNDLAMREYQQGDESPHRSSRRYKQRQEMWENLFYPLRGMKDYRTSVFMELLDKEREIARLKKLCKDNNIDPENPNDIPF